MPLSPLLILLTIFTISSGVLVFFQRKLLHSVLFLAATAVASSLIFLYLGQVLVSLLQLLVFVGGLSTYLLVAVAAEERRTKLLSMTRFFAAVVVLAIALSALVYGIPEGNLNMNSFSTKAQSAFLLYYSLLFASVTVLFAAAIGSIIVIKKFSKLVV